MGSRWNEISSSTTARSAPSCWWVKERASVPAFGIAIAEFCLAKAVPIPTGVLKSNIGAPSAVIATAMTEAPWLGRDAQLKEKR